MAASTEWTLRAMNMNYIIRITIGIFGLVLNTLQIKSIARKEKIKSPFEITLLSVAAADFIVSATAVVGITVILLISNSVIQLKNFEGFILLNPLVTYLSVSSSLLHVSYLAVQRVLVIFCPLNFKHNANKRCMIAIALIWLSSGVYILLIILKFYRLFTILAYLTIICGAVLVLSYSFICYRIKKRIHLLASQRSTSHATSQVVLIQNQSVLAYSMCVTVAFLICNVPNSVNVLIGFRACRMLRNFSEWLLYLNSALNPLLYFLFDYFKQGLILCCCSTSKSNRVATIGATEEKNAKIVLKIDP